MYTHACTDRQTGRYTHTHTHMHTYTHTHTHIHTHTHTPAHTHAHTHLSVVRELETHVLLLQVGVEASIGAGATSGSSCSGGGRRGRRSTRDCWGPLARSLGLRRRRGREKGREKEGGREG